MLCYRVTRSILLVRKLKEIPQHGIQQVYLSHEAWRSQYEVTLGAQGAEEPRLHAAP
jgi:hypothetical protein